MRSTDLTSHINLTHCIPVCIPKITKMGLTFIYYPVNKLCNWTNMECPQKRTVRGNGLRFRNIARFSVVIIHPTTRSVMQRLASSLPLMSHSVVFDSDIPINGIQISLVESRGSYRHIQNYSKGDQNSSACDSLCSN